MPASQTPSPTTRRRDRLVLAGAAIVATGALTFGGIALTNAWFTSQATVTGQSVATATVEISAGLAVDTPPIAVTDLLPGDEAVTTIAVSNTGTEDIYYAVGPFVATGSTDLREQLQVTVVVNGDPATTTTHSLWEWEFGQYEGIALAAGATTEVSVIVSLPTTAGNELQDTEAGFSIGFDAIQARNFTGTTTPTWVSAE
ncbi:hypothetical protein AB0N73_14150 [Microbacterium sp. NPDC089189]|uniref:hypothetical protein n=1 Tax=Microbacterium sp. NPDC089189 TaxID=3154972 RepID=UPI00341834B0